MFKTNFTDVLKTFDKDEFKRFIDYVNSPFFNTNRSIIKLVDAVKKYYPGFDNRNFTKEKIYEKVFSAKDYNDQVMRNLMSDSLQLVYGFLAVKNMPSRKIQNSIYILDELRTKKLDPLYEKNLKAAQKLINEENSVNFSYFEWLYKIEGEIFMNELVHNRQEGVYPVVIKQSEYVTYDYLSKLINHLIDMAVNERYFMVQEPSTLTKEIFLSINVEKIIERLRDISEKEATILSVFYYRAMTILDGGEEHYSKFKKLFFDNAEMFDRTARYNMITSLETYCIDNIKNNPQKFRHELHEVHLKIIELNVVKLIEEDYISLHRFWNFFINSVEIGKTDWAEKFVEDYYEELDPDIKTGALNYAQAIILYKRGDYGPALEKLNKAKLSQYLFKLGIKTFYLRIYYEKGDFESASFALDSYKQFLYKNKKISETYREGYLNFASVYYDLLKAKSSGGLTDKTDIQHKLETIPNVYNKIWLAEMLNEIT
jgi:hypothetical protein